MFFKISPRQKVKFYLNFNFYLINLCSFNKSLILEIKGYLQFQIHQLQKKFPGLTFKNQMDRIAELELHFPVFQFLFTAFSCKKNQKPHPTM